MTQTYQIGKVGTKIHTHEGVTYVTYHATDVVKFDQDMIILDTGGWFTNTTRTRMNQTSNQFDLGYHVYQKDYTWYVDHAKRDGTPETHAFTGRWIGLSR